MIHPVIHARRLALLVEDSVVNQQILANMLHREGFDVVLADNGQDAVEKFKQQAFDVVIMDVQMPVMDGLQATRLMRQHESASDQATPIIAVTAGIDRVSCLDAGMNDYLAKPVRFTAFHETLARSFS
jgi:CheY-like chemotaxis protein